MRMFGAKYNTVLVILVLAMIGFFVSCYFMPENPTTMAEETAISLNEIDNQISVEEEITEEEQLEELAKINKQYYSADSVLAYVLRSMKNCIGYTSSVYGSLPLGPIGTQTLGVKKQINKKTNKSLVQCYAVKIGLLGYDFAMRYYSNSESICVQRANYKNNEFKFGNTATDYEPNTFIQTFGLHPSDLFIQLNPDYIKSSGYVRKIDGYQLNLITDTMSMTADMFQYCFAMFGMAKYGAPEPKSENMYFSIDIDFYGNIQTIAIATTFSCDMKCIGFPGVVVTETLKLTETFSNYNKNIKIADFSGEIVNKVGK